MSIFVWIQPSSCQGSTNPEDNKPASCSAWMTNNFIPVLDSRKPECHRSWHTNGVCIVLPGCNTLQVACNSKISKKFTSVSLELFLGGTLTDITNVVISNLYLISCVSAVRVWVKYCPSYNGLHLNFINLHLLAKSIIEKDLRKVKLYSVDHSYCHINLVMKTLYQR